jgi:hypothetical protein
VSKDTLRESVDFDEKEMSRSGIQLEENLESSQSKDSKIMVKTFLPNS